jgi:hypothetical protein
MITSWQQFFSAVDAMRAAQLDYEKFAAPSAALSRKEWEKEVDTCIESKKREWAAKAATQQKELFTEGKNG